MWGGWGNKVMKRYQYQLIETLGITGAWVSWVLLSRTIVGWLVLLVAFVVYGVSSYCEGVARGEGRI